MLVEGRQQSFLAELADDVACRFLAYAERFGGFLAVERLALVDAVSAMREDEVTFRRFRLFRRGLADGLIVGQDVLMRLLFRWQVRGEESCLA